MWLLDESVQIPSDFTNNTLWNEILTDTSCYVHVGIQGHILVKALDKPSLFPRARQTQVLRCFVMEGTGDRTHSRHSMSVWQTHRSVRCVSPRGQMRESLSTIIHKLEEEALRFGTCAQWLFHVFDYLCLWLSTVRHFQHHLKAA